MNFIIETKTELTDELIAGVLVSAFEGGIGYWACIEQVTFRVAPQSDLTEPGWLMVGDEGHPSYIAGSLLPGGDVAISDTEDDQNAEAHPKLYHINREAVSRGLHLMANGEFRQHFNDIIKEIYDATTGDILIQLAVFGEVKYG